MPVIIVAGLALAARLIFGAPFDPDRRRRAPAVVRVQEVPAGYQPAPQGGDWRRTAWRWAVIAAVIYIVYLSAVVP